MPRRLLIHLPAKDEAKNIGAVLEGLPKELAGISSVDVLVVDDGSSDGTGGIARAHGAHVIRHAKNRGVGGAFRTATMYALEERYDILVNMDADGQFDPAEVQMLVDPIVRGEADFVTGTRFKNGYRHWNPFKHWGNTFFTNLISFIVGAKYTDTQCGYRAYSREALLRLNLMGEFTYTQEVFIDLATKGIAIKEVPINVRKRMSGKSRVANNVVAYGFRSLKIITRAVRDYRPLNFFGIPGMTVFGIGSAVLFGCFVYWLLFFQVTPIRTYLLLGAGLFLFGFMLILLALLADMFDRHRKLQEEILYRLRK